MKKPHILALFTDWVSNACLLSPVVTWSLTQLATRMQPQVAPMPPSLCGEHMSQSLTPHHPALTRLKRQLLWFALLSLATFGLALPASSINQAFAQETFNSSEAPSSPTGTQGVEGNPDCAPPTIIENGVPVTPLNWSCDSSHYWDRPQIVVNDPCEPNYDMSTPAGIAEAQREAPQNKIACDEMLCSHNPDLDVCKQIVVQTPPTDPLREPPQYQQVPGMPPPACDTNAAGFTDSQMKVLASALSNARNMLAKTQAAVDPALWSKQTSQVSQTWFGNTSFATRNLIRARVDRAVDKANALNLSNFASMPPPLGKPNACAFVYADDDTTIYITSVFWQTPPSFQAKTIVCEISHFNSVGSTKDNSYDLEWCQAMASASQSWSGQVTTAMIGQGDPAKRMQCNATSFQEFVAGVAAQSK
jgi:hypothetical protein